MRLQQQTCDGDTQSINEKYAQSLLEELKIRTHNIEHIPLEYRNHRGFMYEAIKIVGLCGIQYASTELRNNSIFMNVVYDHFQRLLEEEEEGE